VAVVQQPGADAGLAIRPHEVNRPIARRYVDQDAVHGFIVGPSSVGFLASRYTLNHLIVGVYKAH
jgi:hypothetical protein